MENKHDWAVNKQKLAVAIKFLHDQKKANPALVIDDEAIKAEYVKRGGLLSENAPVQPVAEPVKGLRRRTK